MKFKEFGLGGGGDARPKFYYVDPPLQGEVIPLHLIKMLQI